MTCQSNDLPVAPGPGCGRERRLAPDGDVLCGHNRWDPATGAMVACEGSGQAPSTHSAPAMVRYAHLLTPG